MANALTAFSPEYWSKRVQFLLQNSLVSRDLANMEERPLLQNGTKVHRPTISDVTIEDYVKGTDVTPQDIAAGDEYLTIDQTKDVSFYIDQVDVIQNKYDVANRMIDRATYRLKNDMDGDFLEEVSNASITYDDSDLSGGTSGAGVSLNVSNIVRATAKAKAKLVANQVEDTKERAAVVTPDFAALLEQTFIANGFNSADKNLEGGAKIGNGKIGRFMGMTWYASNNVRHYQLLTLSGNISADDTVTVAGVVFTFKASPAVAGEVDVGTDQATSVNNLAAAINGGAGAGTAYIALSVANRKTLRTIRATASNVGNNLVVYTAGPSTKSEASSVASRGTQLAYNYFGQVGAIDMVIQKDVTAQINKEPKKTGYTSILYDLYGIKTFTE